MADTLNSATVFWPVEFVFHYVLDNMRTYDPASVLSPTLKWMFDGETDLTCLLESVLDIGQENGETDRETYAINATIQITKPYKVGFVSS